MSAYAAAAAQHVRAVRLNSKAMRVLVAFVVLCAIGAVLFLAGERQDNRTTVLTGVAHTGTYEATVTVGGWSYGISGSVTWFDSQGAQHESSWPSCLSGAGRHVPITFGAVPVKGPGGRSWRDVVWVDCRR